jgi:hypothetical protein
MEAAGRRRAMGSASDNSFSTRPARVLRTALLALAGGHAVAVGAGLVLDWGIVVFVSAGALAMALGGLLLFMSGYADQTQFGELTGELWQAFLPKPFTPQELAVKVRSMLGPAAEH